MLHNQLHYIVEYKEVFMNEVDLYDCIQKCLVCIIMPTHENVFLFLMNNIFYCSKKTCFSKLLRLFLINTGGNFNNKIVVHTNLNKL